MALGSQRGGAYDLTPFNRRVYLTMIDVSRYRERRARNVNEPTIFSLGWDFIFILDTQVFLSQPRLPRLHRDRGRPTWGATASPHAQGPRSLANWCAM